MTRSLVVAPQWIGDAVMSEPLMARLAARGEQLTVGALPWVAPVYRAMPQVQAVEEWPFAHGKLDWEARRRLAASLKGRFDSAYVLPNSIKSALVPFLARIPRRVGYRGESRVGLLTDRLPNPEGRPPMVAFYAALAGRSQEDAGPPRVFLTPTGGGPGAAQTWGRSPAPVAGQEAAERPRLQFPAGQVERVTAAAGVGVRGYWAFAPGAEYGPAKRWPAEHYAALARSLHVQGAGGVPGGLPVLLLGSGKEAELCDAIAAMAADACRVVAGGVPLIDAMGLIAGARGVVTNDSGLMHVAAAFGVPQVAVFGSTSPEHTPPLNPRARVLWLKDELALDCAPCFERQCRFGHTRCLTGVEPARVEQALAEALRADPNGVVAQPH